MILEAVFIWVPPEANAEARISKWFIWEAIPGNTTKGVSWGRKEANKRSIINKLPLWASGVWFCYGTPGADVEQCLGVVPPQGRGHTYINIHTSSWCRDAEVEATYSLHRKCPQVRNEGAGSQKSDQSHSVIRVRRYDGGREWRECPRMKGMPQQLP